MKIAEAAEIVLRDASKPMHAREIAAEIQSRQLYEFRTNDIVSVVSKALRQGEKFSKTAPGMFKLR